MLAGGVGAGTATVVAQQAGGAGQHRAAPESTTPSSTTAAPTTTTTTTTTSKPAKPKPKKPKPRSTTAKPSTSRSTPKPTPSEDNLPETPVLQVIDLVNQARSDAGCDPVKVDQRLNRAAAKHSVDMAERNYFSHDTPEGEDFAERIRAEGYPSPGAENIAQGQRNARTVMEAWMQSEGHRNNILNCELSAIGVGFAREEFVWTQDFGY